MEIYRVAFIGHRDVSDAVHTQARLARVVADLLRRHAFVEFYVGRNGAFDHMAASEVKRLQKTHGHENSALILVLPYKVKEMAFYETQYDDVMLPLPASTYPKAAITQRNRWMMEQAELLVCYVERAGGAMTAMRYAEQRGVPVLNLVYELPEDDGCLR